MAALLAVIAPLTAVPTSVAETGPVATGRWTSPQVHRLSTQVWAVTATAFAPSGRGFITLLPQTRAGRTPAAYLAANQIRVVGPSGSLGRAFRLPYADGQLTGSVGAAGRAVVVATRQKSPGSVTISDLTPAGRRVHQQTVASPGQRVLSATACAASSGDGLVVWTERKGKGSLTLAMARRQANGRLSAPVQLTSTTAWTFGCSVAPDGRWVLAAAVRPRTGDPSVPRLVAWTGSVHHAPRHHFDLGVAPNSTSLQTAIDGGGRSYIVWRSQLPESEYAAGPDEPFRVRAATIPPDGDIATPTQILEAGDGDGGPGQIAASPTGGALLEMSLPVLEEDAATNNPGISVTAASPQGIFSPLSPPIPGAVAQGPIQYRPDGTAIAAWRGPNRPQLLAAPVSGTTIGPVEDTGLRGDGQSFATPTRSGEPRLYTLNVTKSTSTLSSATRISP